MGQINLVQCTDQRFISSCVSLCDLISAKPYMCGCMSCIHTVPVFECACVYVWPLHPWG